MEKKNIHIIFIDSEGTFIASKDRHIKFIYLE